MLQDIFTISAGVFIGMTFTELIFVIFYPVLVKLLIKGFKGENNWDLI